MYSKRETKQTHTNTQTFTAERGRERETHMKKAHKAESF